MDRSIRNISAGKARTYLRNRYSEEHRDYYYELINKYKNEEMIPISYAKRRALYQAAITKLVIRHRREYQLRYRQEIERLEYEG